MFRAYIDESGHEALSWVIVGGFFGHEDEWERFVPLWKQGLGPQRKSLHMSDLRWKKDSTRRLLERLGPIPDSCGLRRCVGGVNVQHYQDLIAGTMAEKALKGYQAALTPMVIHVLRAVPPTERIEFVFEEQREYEEAVHNTMHFAATIRHDYQVTADGLPKVAKWGFVPKGSTVMTDPADYLVYAAREFQIDWKSQRAQWCLPILASGDTMAYGAILTREEIRGRIQKTFDAIADGSWIDVL
jgi:hypothetical protein